MSFMVNQSQSQCKSPDSALPCSSVAVDEGKEKNRKRGKNKWKNLTEHKCALCSYSTRHITHYKNHLATHSSEKPFKCPECPYRAKWKKNIHQHLKFVHLLPSTRESSRPFPCSESGCNFRAKDKSNLNKHSKIHSDEKSFVCSHPNCNFATTYKNSLAAHTRLHTGEKPYVCQFESCTFAAATLSHFQNHFRTHTKERPFKCPEANCEYSAAQNTNLKRHQQNYHPNSNPSPADGEERPTFSCPLCEYSAKIKDRLSQHIKQKHIEEKPWACSFESCTFRCKIKYVLDNHLKTHSEERQYKCELCPFRGKTRQTVTKHIQTVHTQPNLRPFKCTEPKCAYASKTNSNLNVHLLSHKGEKKYACSYLNCAYRSVIKCNVKSHEYNIHSEEKKETCQICDFKCKNKFALSSHLRTHSKDEPFICQEVGCEYRSKQPSGLYHHKKRNHPQS